MVFFLSSAHSSLSAVEISDANLFFFLPHPGLLY